LTIVDNVPNCTLHRPTSEWKAGVYFGISEGSKAFSNNFFRQIGRKIGRTDLRKINVPATEVFVHNISRRVVVDKPSSTGQTRRIIDVWGIFFDALFIIGIDGPAGVQLICVDAMSKINTIPIKNKAREGSSEEFGVEIRRINSRPKVSGDAVLNLSWESRFEKVDASNFLDFSVKCDNNRDIAVTILWFRNERTAHACARLVREGSGELSGSRVIISLRMRNIFTAATRRNVGQVKQRLPVIIEVISRGQFVTIHREADLEVITLVNNANSAHIHGTRRIPSAGNQVVLLIRAPRHRGWSR
jgi:hypothetical protein